MNGQFYTEAIRIRPKKRPRKINQICAGVFSAIKRLKKVKKVKKKLKKLCLRVKWERIETAGCYNYIIS